MRYLIGLDIGTSGAKCIIADEYGRVAASATIEYPLYTPQPGWAEQDPADWWEAVAEGSKKILSKSGVALSDIEEVDIAGAFGNYINPDSACAIGLIPAELRQRIVPVGNAAGAGAKLALTDAAAWAEAETLARTTEFLELATLPEFQDEFVEQLNFEDEDED